MFRKILANFGVRVGSALLNLILAILFSQILGPEGKGQQSLLLTTIAIIIIFEGFVGGAALVYLSSRVSWVRLLIASNAWIAIVCLGAYQLLIHQFDFQNSAALHIVLLSAISAVTSVNSSLLLGNQQLKSYNFIQLMVPMVTLIVALVQVQIWHNIYYQEALYFAYGLALFISFLFLINAWTQQTQQTSWTEVWHKLFSLGLVNQLAHVLQLLSFRLTFYLLEQQGQDAGVGIMSNASSITESIWLVASSISLWQYAVISNSSDIVYNQQITEKLARYGMLVSLMVLGVFLLLPGSFYGFVFGPSFVGIQSLMLVLAPGVWVFTYALIVGHYFSGMGKYWVNALASAIGLIVCYSCAVYLIPKHAALGAGLSMTASYIVTTLVVAYFFLNAGGKLYVFPQLSEIKMLIERLGRSVKSRTHV